MPQMLFFRYWKSGVPHGYQREFGPKDFDTKRLVGFVGRYFRGVRRGFCFKGCFGGGFLCGFVNNAGDFTGRDVAYIYPDWQTALRGEMKDERLVKAKRCVVPAISSVRTTFFYGYCVQAK